MEFSDKSEEIDWSDSIVKIVGGSAESVVNNLRIVEGDYNHQWIDVLLLESFDLSGYKLEYRSVGASAEGTVFRLKDFQNNVLYTYILYKASSFAELMPNIIRNEDGIRCFVFIPEQNMPNSELNSGTYQCTFTYHREAERQPTLKRFGFKEEESAIIQFSVSSGK